MKYKVIVEVDVGEHDFTLEVEAANPDEAKELAKSMVFDTMTFDDFGSSLTIWPWKVEPQE